MITPTTLSIALDKSIENADRLITSLLRKMRQYNDQVEKSNKLLREQETLRKRLNIKVEKGKTIGLVEEPKKDK